MLSSKAADVRQRDLIQMWKYSQMLYIIILVSVTIFTSTENPIRKIMRK